jgi:hypothetical protein
LLIIEAHYLEIKMFFIPKRPNCCYCGKPVDSGSWDTESGGWFSYGSGCMSDHRDGRFVVEETTSKGTRIIRRFATMLRAVRVAEQYTRDNARCQWPEIPTWTARDLGVGTVTECTAD